MVLLSILTLMAGLVIFAYYKDCDTSKVMYSSLAKLQRYKMQFNSGISKNDIIFFALNLIYK